MALTSCAARLGLSAGSLLTDARALVPELQTATREAEAARADLLKLVRWCERYTPYAAVDMPNGIFLDVTGSVHLFGGEQQVLEDIKARFSTFFLQTRLACADNAGAAWAMARYSGAPSIVVAKDGQRGALATLPVTALRIEEEIADKLYKLGFKSISQLYDMPRGPLAARFGKQLLIKLDQALGHINETISPLTPPFHYSVRLASLEPISLLEHIEVAVRQLAEKLASQLEAGGRGAKLFILKLFGVDSSVRVIEVNAAKLCYRAERISALFHERIKSLEPSYNSEVGIDVLVLEAHSVENLQYAQKGFDQDEHNDELSFLLDRLTARLGRNAIRRLDPVESHIPELAQQPTHIANVRSLARFTKIPRPLLLLPKPEPVEVVAEIPDGPPARLTWRKVSRRIAAADGPERIACEWWKEDRPTRDYFHVEDESHRRYWLFREGLYGESVTPRWFLHGLFP